MTKNDYIAEYVREKRPEILNEDFRRWKTARILKEFVDSWSKAFIALRKLKNDGGQEK